MSLRSSCIVVAFATLAGTGYAVTSAATSSAPVPVPVPAPVSAPASTEPGTGSASAGSVTGSKQISSPAGTSSLAVTSQPQVYVTAAQLLNASDGAIVVKDCPAQGSCAFRVDVTSDGGTTWRRGRNLVIADAADDGAASMEDPIIGLTMVSASEMFAFGSSLWHTTDAGATWMQLSGAPAVDTISSSDGEIWAAVACADVSGCASSIDAISSGRFVPLAHQPGGPVGSIVREGTNAFAVVRDAGGVGALAVSRDNGKSWHQRPLPQKFCTYSLGQAMTITAAGTLYLICANGASAGTEQKDLFATDNGALSWQHLAVLESEGYAGGIVAATPDILWRDGARAPMFVSSDAGRTWHAELGDKVGDAAGPMTQAFAAAGTIALAFAFALPADPTFTGPWTINEYRTTDAGARWQTLPAQP